MVGDAQCRTCVRLRPLFARLVAGQERCGRQQRGFAGEGGLQLCENCDEHSRLEGIHRFQHSRTPGHPKRPGLRPVLRLTKVSDLAAFLPARPSWVWQLNEGVVRVHTSDSLRRPGLDSQSAGLREHLLETGIPSFWGRKPCG